MNTVDAGTPRPQWQSPGRNPDVALPLDLGIEGQRAWEVIIAQMRRFRTKFYTGGCRAFFSADEWTKKLGNRYGRGAELIVVYDGGSLPDFFRLGENENRYTAMRDALREVDLYSEELTYCSSSIHIIVPDSIERMTSVELAEALVTVGHHDVHEKQRFHLTREAARRLRMLA